MIASIMGIPNWLYYSIFAIGALALIGYLVYSMKNRDDDDE